MMELAESAMRVSRFNSSQEALTAILEQHESGIVLIEIDYERVWEEYALECGKEELTRQEKQQALLNHILSSGNDIV